MKLSDAEKQRFESYVKEANEAAFQGWDFSYMAQYGGNPGDPLEWSYHKTARDYFKDADILLDMETGGGEILASLQPLPQQTYATEAHPPNISVAKKKLEPFGVHVVGIEEGRQEAYPLPFEDNFFNLILNRHGAYDSREIARILKQDGVFITQQVGDKNSENLRMMFGTLEDDCDFAWNLRMSQSFLENTGFHILDAKEHIGYSRFYDIRALIYLLKAVPWDFPNFNPVTCSSQLLNIYLKILEDGYFDDTLHQFFVIAQKK